MRVVLCLALLTIAAAPAPLPIAHYRAVPFVGCPADGQQGPEPAPDHPTKPLPVWTPARASLAYYGGRYTEGVLAPAGWHCQEREGSNGSTLLVTPEPRDAAKGDRLAGPAVQLSYSLGGTSGRFEVADIAARIFPVAHDFVDDVEREKILDRPLVHHPFASDHILSRDATHVRYVTPAGRGGLGTQSLLVPSSRPIDGLAILHDKPQEDMVLAMLSVRLPATQGALVEPIIGQVRDAQR